MSSRSSSWVPDPDDVESAAITRFARWAVAKRGAPPGAADTYAALHRWSIDELGAFWAAVADFFDIVPGRSASDVLAGASMPDVRWFPGAEVSYVEYLFRDRPKSQIAVIDVAEADSPTGSTVVRTLTWLELQTEVAAFAATLRGLGVVTGDRVVGYLPTTAESVIAFLAAASIGAVWASCGQDYAPAAAAARFGQLAPVVLVAADGYRFGGKLHDRRDAVEQLRANLPALRATVLVSRIGAGVPQGMMGWDEATAGEHELAPMAVPFDHPLWVVFSSGTTGVPKGLVHGHGGVLLEHVKSLALQNNLGPDDRFFWYTTPSWMLWNYLVSAMLVGAAIVCYDGSPTHPDTDGLWALAAAHGVTFLGVSPGYLINCEKAGVEPGTRHDLTRLRALASSGSHLPATSNAWIGSHVNPRLHVISVSGGTDVVSSFAGAAPNLPVWSGELSAPCLGVALQAWDPAGQPVVGDMGELVVTLPMPSMPLRFWDDPDNIRYRQAYFDVYPGAWRHGDWIMITARGSVIVHGRSDSTLNRNGIRMGSSDIYQVVEAFPEIAEALVIGAEQPDGSYWMPLFVRLASGVELDEELCRRIRRAVRLRASPRHVPDEIRAVPGIPHTRTGKKLEVPVKRVLQGMDPETVVDAGAVDDVGLLAFFAIYWRDRANAERKGPAIPLGSIVANDATQP